MRTFIFTMLLMVSGCASVHIVPVDPDWRVNQAACIKSLGAHVTHIGWDTVAQFCSQKEAQDLYGRLLEEFGAIALDMEGEK